MVRRVFPLLVMLPALLASSCTGSDRTQTDAPRDQPSATGPAAIHEDALTIDSHAGFTGDPLQSCGETERQVDFVKMRRGGMDAVFLTVYAEEKPRTDETRRRAREQALETFGAIHRLTEECPDAALARSPEDLRRLVGEGRAAIAIGIENGFTLGGDPDVVERYADLGAAYVGLTHDGHNDLADSAIPREELGDTEQEHGGLSPLGEQVIRELARLGVMVDVSHMSKEATLDAIGLSEAPVIASTRRRGGSRPSAGRSSRLDWPASKSAGPSPPWWTSSTTSIMRSIWWASITWGSDRTSRAGAGSTAGPMPARP